MKRNNLSESDGIVPVLVVFAPTASGKTALSLKLFGRGSHSFFKDTAEIISADSMQVYGGMNIGTAKPGIEIRAAVPHHLIDVCSPSDQFSVADFVTAADACCADIYARGKLPVVMGGTGFYIRCFLLGLPKTPEADETVRILLKKRLAEYGSEILYKELSEKDPVSAAKIHPNDSYRIVRALEVCYTTGKPRSAFELPSELRRGYRFLTLVLERPRSELYERIDRRVDEMFAAGLPDEYLGLVREGFTEASPGMKAIGYREFAAARYEACSDAEKSKLLEKIKLQVKSDSRRYAKKQYTFVRDIPGSKICPVNGETSGLETVERLIADFYARIHLT